MTEKPSVTELRLSGNKEKLLSFLCSKADIFPANEDGSPKNVLNLRIEQEYIAFSSLNAVLIKDFRFELIHRLTQHGIGGVKMLIVSNDVVKPTLSI